MKQIKTITLFTKFYIEFLTKYIFFIMLITCAVLRACNTGMNCLHCTNIENMKFSLINFIYHKF